MYKKIINHKTFILFVLILATLTLGLLFFQNSEKYTYADYDDVYFYYKAYWYNGADCPTSATAKEGTYTSANGDNTKSSIGSISANYPKIGSTNKEYLSNGTRYKASTNTSNTGNGDYAYIRVKEDFPWYWLAGDYKVSCYSEAKPSSGFRCTYFYTYQETKTEQKSVTFPDSVTVNISSQAVDYGYYSNMTYTTKTITMGTAETAYQGGNSVALYAVFFPAKFTINFNANGGKYSDNTTSKSVKDVVFYEDYPSAPATPTRSGYTFNGWHTSSSSDTPVTLNDTCFSSTSNTTLYAHWTANTYNVTLDRNIASGTSDLTGGNYRAGTASLSVKYNSTYQSITTPIRNGYTFNGYYTAGGTKIYNASGTSSVKCTTADHHTLYANWTANTIEVTLNHQSGTSTRDEFYYKYDTNRYYSNASCTTSLSSIPIPTRTGYTFGGYYTGTNGGGTQYITASGSFTNSLFKNIYASSTLYAKWTENDYSIQYLPNGGSGSMSNSTGILYTTSFTLPTNAFYRYGYLFKGWATSAVAVDASITYYDQQTVSKLSATDNDIVKLYAVWEKTWAVDKQTPSGAGTMTNPYLISTPQHLGWMAYQTETNYLSGYFKQTANISLTGETYLPIGNSSWSFLGNYDGNNYVITNLTTTETRIKSNTGNFKYSYQGLFGYTNNATIDNVKLLSGIIKGYNYTGGIVGYAYTSTKLTNNQVGSVSIYANGNYSGGLAGYFYNASATACYSKAQMSGGGYYGGIGGYIQATTLTACAFEGTLANTYYGYQIGYAYSTASKNIFTDCFAKTTTANGFVRGSFTKDSCLYIAGTNKKYYAGNFTNWVITTTNTPLPQGLSWLATGGTKVTSVNDITALGFTQA